MNDYTLIDEDRILRPVTVDDAEFIVKLRNQEHAKGFIHKTSLNVESQRQWIADYLKRENEYYWILTDLEGTPYGTQSLYDYNEEHNTIVVGRWVKIPGFENNAISSHVQLFDFAFNILNVHAVINDVVSTNKGVLKYHRFLGEKEFYHEYNVKGVEDGTVERIWFKEEKESWAINRKKLMAYCGDMTKWDIIKNINHLNY